MLERYQEVNLKLNLAKCSFEKSELKYLGHIVQQGVIKADPSKIKSIVYMPVPQNVQELHKLLSMST